MISRTNEGGSSLCWIDHNLLAETLSVIIAKETPLYGELAIKSAQRAFDAIHSNEAEASVQEFFQRIPVLGRTHLSSIQVRDRTFVPESEVVFYGTTSGTTSSMPLLIPFAHVHDYVFDPTFGGEITRPLIVYPPLLGSFGHSFVRQCRERDVPATPIFADYRNLANAAVLARETGADAFYATPTIAVAFAEMCTRFFDARCIKFVVLGSETITESQREKIKAVFTEARIVNLYASAEVGQFVLVPPSDINTQSQHDEFVPLKGSVAALELLDSELHITYGNNRATPLVRYATGDRFECVRYLDDGRPVLRWLHREGVDRIRVQGIEITVSKVDEILSKIISTKTSGRYQVRFVEQDSGTVKIEIDIERLGAPDISQERVSSQYIENAFGEEWILPSGKNFNSLIEQGIFSVPSVAYVDAIGGGSVKAKRLLYVAKQK